MSAGQIDALYVDSTGSYYLFDFKRVAKHHKLDPKDKGFAVRGEDPPVGSGPMAHLPDTHFQKYSLQTSIYNLMLLDTHGVDVGDRMYLLRVHSDRAAYELVQCRDLRTEAKVALQSEADRLAARPPPPPLPAQPDAAQPTATSPAAASPPADAAAAPAAHGSSGMRKRPRGAAPGGQVWQDGDWVHPSAARAVPGPSPATAINRGGRPRKPGFRGHKRTAEAPAVADENCANPQQQPAACAAPERTKCVRPRLQRA